MQANIPSNLQTNIPQVRPVPDKYNIEWYLEAMTYNLSNKDNHLWNESCRIQFDTMTNLSRNWVVFTAQIW